jgi:cold-inducible RNA-binding protein
MRIYVGNLASTITAGDVEQAFVAYGSVSSIMIVRGQPSGFSHGFGFVEMDEDRQGREAISRLDGSSLGARAISVKEASPRPQRPKVYLPRW